MGKIIKVIFKTSLASVQIFIPVLCVAAMAVVIGDIGYEAKQKNVTVSLKGTKKWRTHMNNEKYERLDKQGRKELYKGCIDRMNEGWEWILVDGE